jgi:hypothetical protein
VAAWLQAARFRIARNAIAPETAILGLVSQENIKLIRAAFDAVNANDVDALLEPWAMQSVAFARALPPKEKK